MNIATKILTRLLQFVNHKLWERREIDTDYDPTYNYITDFGSKHTGDGQLRPRASSESARPQPEGKTQEKTLYYGCTEPGHPSNYAHYHTANGGWC